MNRWYNFSIKICTAVVQHKCVNLLYKHSKEYASSCLIHRMGDDSLYIHFQQWQCQVSQNLLCDFYCKTNVSLTSFYCSYSSVCNVSFKSNVFDLHPRCISQTLTPLLVRTVIHIHMYLWGCFSLLYRFRDELIISLMNHLISLIPN